MRELSIPRTCEGLINNVDTLAWYQVALISVLRQQALELENGLERESKEVCVTRTSCQLVSLRVLERIYLRCVLRGVGEQGAPQRDSQVREVRMQREDSRLSYREIVLALLPRHLNEWKTSDGEERERKRTEQSREIEEPFRSHFGVWPAVVLILRIVFPNREMFSLSIIFFNIYIII